MPRKSVKILFICSTCILIMALFAVGLTTVDAENRFQTWPSRTPTPRPGQTQPPGGPTPGGNNPATATSEPAPSASPVGILTEPAASPLPPTVEQPLPGSTIIPVVPPEPGTEITVESGLAPSTSVQVAGCEIPPLVEALGSVSVKAGVGIDQETIGNLQLADQRTILGRADSATWWLIQFDSENTGWVLNQAVLVHGYTGYVPVINVENAAVGTLNTWNPTPNPACTPPAPDTFTDDGSGSTTVVDSDGAEESGLKADGQQNTSEQGPESPDNQADPRNSPGIDDLQESSQSSDPTLIWLLITGVFLIVVGGVSFVLRRRNY